MMQNKKLSTLKIAITGGIGSGKSTVCQILINAGYSVYSCDEIYHEIQNEPDFLNTIQKNFNGVVENGQLNKEKLSAVVFSDSNALNRLNQITHPLIMQRLHAKMEEHSVAFAEVPLLFETARENEFDAVIVVMRDKNERIQSVCLRDGKDSRQVLRRMENQVDYDKLSLYPYNVIYNEGDMQALKERTLKLAEEIIRAGKKI